MIFWFRGKWHMWVLPFQTIDMHTLVSSATAITVTIDTVHVCAYGTLIGTLQTVSKGKVTMSA